MITMPCRSLPKTSHNFTVSRAREGCVVSERRPSTARHRPFVWTPERERALDLLVTGRMTATAIAREIGISRRTLFTWSRHPDIVARAERIVEAFREESLRDAIARGIR
jgi:Helix-turn-helix of insertion element transposase